MDWTGIKVATAPTIEPVTVSEAKIACSVDASDTVYDTMLAGFISAARGAIESCTGRTLINTTYELCFDYFPCEIKLLRPPIQSVTSIKYIDTDGVEQTLSSSLYRVDTVSLMGRITPAYGQVWPAAQDVSNAVKVTYVAGYGTTASTVPAEAKVWIQGIVADLFKNRESTVEINLKENTTYKFIASKLKIPVIA